MRAEDLPWVKDTFAKSYQDAPASRHVHGPIYKRGARQLVDILFERAECWVATPPKYPDLLLGWACVERQDPAAVVHYLYVKKAYRKAGVARALVSFLFDLLEVDPSGDIRFSHWREPAGKIARRHGWRFDPYALSDRKTA